MYFIMTVLFIPKRTQVYYKYLILNVCYCEPCIFLTARSGEILPEFTSFETRNVTDRIATGASH